MSTVTATAGAALAHFFIGLMKADGYISKAEERKVEILVNKFRRGLPCTSEEVIDAQSGILQNDQFKDWMPKEHLDAGFDQFDQFVKSDTATEEHMATIVEMLEILAEVDGVTDSEVLFLDMIREGMSSRYGMDA